MNFSTLSIRNPIPAIMLFVLLTLGGLMAFHVNKIQDLPDVQMPIVNVDATLEGSTPAQLETDVAQKLENAIAGVQGIRNIYTKILDGHVTLTIEFNLEKPIDEAVDEVRDAVAQVRTDLPADMRDPEVVKASPTGRMVISFSAVAAPGSALDTEALSWLVDHDLKKALLDVPGIGNVDRIGGVDREVRVQLDPQRMAALQVSALDVSRRLKQVQQGTAGGRGEVGGAEQSVRTVATVGSAAQLARIELPLADGRHVRLDQVATVSDSVAEPRSVALVDGRPVVAFEVFRSKGMSEVDVARDARAAVKKFQASHPDVVFRPIVDNAAPIAENFDGSMALLYDGAILAALVVWLFLRDWRATLVTITALPLSVLPTFIGLLYFGFSLNLVTLLALALVIGVLVDDSIVEIENITRHLRMGKTPLQAATEAAAEIGMAVIATTFALVAVFLPTAFIPGAIGLFFRQFGWTATLAVLASLLVARLLTPMMAAYILKPTPEVTRADGPIMRRYLATVQACLRHRWLTLLGATLFFAASIAVVPLLPTGFMPVPDRGQTLVNVELPPGSTLAETRAAEARARAEAMQIPGMVSVFSSVGGGASGDAFTPGAPAEVRRAVMTLTAVDRNERTSTMAQIEQQLRKRLATIPGARFTVGTLDSGNKSQVVLKSDDPDELAATAQRVERELRTLQGIGNVSSNASLVRPEIVVRPDFARAADLGVTADSIGETVRVATAGDYETNLPKLKLASRQVPIRVRLPDGVRADLGALGRLTVPGKNGPVLLANVASITMQSGPAEIDRLNRSRDVIFDVELGRLTLGTVNDAVNALPAMRNLPPSVQSVQLGDTKEMESLFTSFVIVMSVGVLCIYGVLVLLFKDFLQPVTILAALPLSIGGAFVALLVTGKSLSMPSMIGLIMLMGIVTKNSILLVDYAIIAREAGMSRFDALVDACHKRSRPIVMTTIAMGAGMLPLALGLGADPSFRSPMATAVIGGLMTSTLLSLLVVPVVFTLTDDVERLLRRVRRGVRRGDAENDRKRDELRYMRAE